jgi:hypothetical protein
MNDLRGTSAIVTGRRCSRPTRCCRTCSRTVAEISSPSPRRWARKDSPTRHPPTRARKRPRSSEPRRSAPNCAARESASRSSAPASSPARASSASSPRRRVLATEQGDRRYRPGCARGREDDSDRRGARSSSSRPGARAARPRHPLPRPATCSREHSASRRTCADWASGTGSGRGEDGASRPKQKE